MALTEGQEPSTARTIISRISLICCSGANANAQTTETEETKVKAMERAQTREKAKKEAREKAVEKFKEMQKTKAEKRIKESEKRQKTVKKEARVRPPPTSSLGSTTNAFEQDLGSANPFVERGFSLGSDDGTNPFLDDIRAAASAASAVSGGLNPFEENIRVGECVC